MTNPEHDIKLGINHLSISLLSCYIKFLEGGNNSKEASKGNSQSDSGSFTVTGTSAGVFIVIVVAAAVAAGTRAGAGGGLGASKRGPRTVLGANVILTFVVEGRNIGALGQGRTVFLGVGTPPGGHGASIILESFFDLWRVCNLAGIFFGLGRSPGVQLGGGSRHRGRD